jgi:CobQ/CobB/MinD/ParA nucleotide binding domain
MVSVEPQQHSILTGLAHPATVTAQVRLHKVQVEWAAMATRGKSDNGSDVDRLFEAAGINPSAYVQFDRPRVRTASPSKKNLETTGLPRAGRQSVAGKPLAPTYVPTYVPTHVPTHAPIHVATDVATDVAVDVETRESSAATAVGGLFSWVERISRTPRVNKPLQIMLTSTAPETGKTTLASALAGLFVHRGQAALLIDHSEDNGASRLLGGSEEHFGAVSFGSEGTSRRSFPLLSEFWNGAPCDDFAAWRDLLTTRSRITLLDGLDGVEGPAAAAQQLLQCGGRVLIPVLPNMMSAIDAVRLNDALDGPHSTHVHFLLNRFDESQTLHREVRAGLKMHLGDRLLPIEIEEDRRLLEVARSGGLQGEGMLASSAIRGLCQLLDWLDLESLGGIANDEMEEELS